jgi:hypothetical protein
MGTYYNEYFTFYELLFVLFLLSLYIYEMPFFFSKMFAGTLKKRGETGKAKSKYTRILHPNFRQVSGMYHLFASKHSGNYGWEKHCVYACLSTDAEVQWSSKSFFKLPQIDNVICYMRLF